jgi:predicted enzyme related to lactoylglutathione lyase
MGYPVVHFEVLGKNPQALTSFYKQAFDWEIGPPIGPNNYALAHPQGQGSTNGDGGINGGIGGGMEGYEGHVTFYVAVPDLEAELAKIQRLGGSTMMAPEDVPGGPRIAMFRDPEGHAVGLVQVTNGQP